VLVEYEDPKGFLTLRVSFRNSLAGPPVIRYNALNFIYNRGVICENILMEERNFALLKPDKPLIHREEVLDWFSGLAGFEDVHNTEIPASFARKPAPDD
jgi:hypothetical protein